MIKNDFENRNLSVKFKNCEFMEEK